MYGPGLSTLLETKTFFEKKECWETIFFEEIKRKKGGFWDEDFSNKKKRKKGGWGTKTF